MTWRAALVLLVAVAACTSFSSPDTDASDASVDASAPSTDGSPIEANLPADDAQTSDVDGATPPGSLKVFLTAVGYADITSAGSADAKCAAEAAGRLPGKFVAWYPDTSTGRSAFDRLTRTSGPVDGPWFRVDGRRVVANRAALANAAAMPLENAIVVTAIGATNGGGVWTGTLADGGIGSTCPASTPTTGNASSLDAAWTAQTYFTATCGTSLGLYCFQVE